MSLEITYNVIILGEYGGFFLNIPLCSSFFDDTITGVEHPYQNEWWSEVTSKEVPKILKIQSKSCVFRDHKMIRYDVKEQTPDQREQCDLTSK